MLRGRAALATVFLCVVCALTQKPQTDDRLCSQDAIARVNSSLTKRAADLKRLDSRLYTPRHADVKNCLVSNLTCFAAEVQVLNKEWGHFGKGTFVKVEKLLQSLLKSLKDDGSLPESDCQQCELLQEEDAEKFLGALLAALQYVYSHFCS